jgi:threonine dehydratase
MINYKNIVAAAEILDGVIADTPCVLNRQLSDKYHCEVYLKREDLQVVRSFKIRGAYYKIKKLGSKATTQGIVCASAGNHAQGVAYACSALGIKGTIYMPTTTPNQKISKVRHFGKNWIEIRLVGDTFDDANNLAMKYAEEQGTPFIHPFDDEDVIAGQGTIGLEILHQIPQPIDYLLVAVGGGGLMSGVGSYFKQISPDTKMIAVEATGAPSLKESIAHGRVVKLDTIDTFADGIAVRKMGEKTFEICQEVVDDIVLIPEGKICSVILQLYQDQAIVVEPAGAISVAALDEIKDQIVGKTVVVIICGGNNDIARTEEIRERALLYEKRKHYFIIKFPQRAGALRDFLNVLGPNDDITHFEYTKKNNRDTGPALVGLELANARDFDDLVDRMKASEIGFEHLNNNPMLFEMLV